MTNGKYGKWKMTNGKWQMANGKSACSSLMAELQTFESMRSPLLFVCPRQSFRPFRPTTMYLHPKVVTRLYCRV
jgi:hypothetical protein